MDEERKLFFEMISNLIKMYEAEKNKTLTCPENDEEFEEECDHLTLIMNQSSPEVINMKISIFNEILKCLPKEIKLNDIEVCSIIGEDVLHFIDMIESGKIMPENISCRGIE